ncbi:hypothetical protein C8F01DRAFT_354494 [Mycena amicta]|nr:hypothetical protein C8F01DRAFT_354494 [Mycena amicta]
MSCQLSEVPKCFKSRRIRLRSPAKPSAITIANSHVLHLLPSSFLVPSPADISPDALEAAAPELRGVPDEFIRHSLRSKAPAMLAGISTLAPSHLPQSLPRSRLPPALSVPVRANPQGTALPTHALAMSLATKTGRDDGDAPTSLFPIHAVVLAAHCTKLPPIGPAATSSSSHSIALALLPLALPSPAAFRIIHMWLYSSRVDAVLSSLLPNALPSTFIERLASTYTQAPSSPGSPSLLSSTLETRSTIHALSAHLCTFSAGNLTALMTHASHVKELWQDLVALGIHDPGLWAAVDVVWDVVLGAMNIAAAR